VTLPNHNDPTKKKSDIPREEGAEGGREGLPVSPRKKNPECILTSRVRRPGSNHLPLRKYKKTLASEEVFERSSNRKERKEDGRRFRQHFE